MRRLRPMRFSDMFTPAALRRLRAVQTNVNLRINAFVLEMLRVKVRLQ